jgi:ParB family chromosome partitioning protein
MSTYRVLSRTLLDPAPFNPRKTFDPEALGELAGSLKAYGLLEPLVVRPVGERFQIVAGERRYRASEIAGLEDLPCTVRELDDKSAMEIALLENLQREELDPMEEAEAFRQLVQAGVYTVEGLATRLNKSVRHVYGRMRLCKLAPELAELVGQKRLQASAAELLVKENPYNQVNLAKDLGLFEEGESKELSVRDIKARLKKRQDAEQKRVADIQKERRKLEKQFAEEEAQRAADQEARKKQAAKWWKEFIGNLEELPHADLLRMAFIWQCRESLTEEDAAKEAKWVKKAPPAEVFGRMVLQWETVTEWEIAELLKAFPENCPANPFPAEKEGEK